jgi:hypothetical protein
MNDAPSPSTDRLLSCVLAVGVLCLTLVILAVIAVSAGAP